MIFQLLIVLTMPQSLFFYVTQRLITVLMAPTGVNKSLWTQKTPVCVNAGQASNSGLMGKHARVRVWCFFYLLLKKRNSISFIFFYLYGRKTFLTITGNWFISNDLCIHICCRSNLIIIFFTGFLHDFHFICLVEQQHGVSVPYTVSVCIRRELICW